MSVKRIPETLAKAKCRQKYVFLDTYNALIYYDYLPTLVCGGGGYKDNGFLLIYGTNRIRK